MTPWRQMLEDATKPLGWILCVFLFGMVAESYGGAKLRAEAPDALKARLERVERIVEGLAVGECFRITSQEAARSRLPCAELKAPTLDARP